MLAILAKLLRSDVAGWLAVAAIVAAALGVSYSHGLDVATARLEAKYQAQAAEREAANARAMSEALEQLQTQIKAAKQAERAHVELQAKLDEKYRRLNRSAQAYAKANPNLANCGLDANGLRLWNEANGGESGKQDAGDKRGPTSPMP